ADRITELPGISSGDVLGRQSVFSEVPTLDVLREQQLEFQFVIVLLARESVRLGKVSFDIVTFVFFQYLVGAADLFVLEIKHRVDEMLALQQPKTVLQPEAGEDGAIV